MDPALLEEFAAECGLNQPFQVEVSLKGERTTQLHEFRQPFLLIGRRTGADLLLDHWLVSRRHAYLQLIDGRFFCVDLGSRTGTHGGDATERSGWIDPIRAIQIGPYSVRPELPPFTDFDSPPLPVVTWTLPNRAGEASQWTMNRGLALIGKSPACKIRIPESDVSRFHCGLVLTPGGVWAIDLLTQRPILVNGQPVRFARLQPGDELQIGRHVLVPDYKPLNRDSSNGRTFLPPASAGSRFPTFPTGSNPAGDQLPALTPTVVVPTSLWTPPGSFTLTERSTSQAIDPTVNQLVEQFGAMQQQMFDQFHQTMMMMFEGFATLHRETSGSIRAELEEVRKLSQEIDSLRSETARLAEAATMSFQAPALRKMGHAPGLDSQTGTGSKPELPPSPSPVADASPKRTHAKVAATEPDPHVDIHAQLLERLNSIATERQTRWQKILAMMAKT